MGGRLVTVLAGGAVVAALAGDVLRSVPARAAARSVAEPRQVRPPLPPPLAAPRPSQQAGPVRLRVRFLGAVPGRVPFLLFDGSTGTRCVEDLTLAGRDSVVVSAFGADASCHTQLVAFAPDRAPAAAPTGALDAVRRAGVWRARLRPPDTVVVATWIVAAPADTAALARRLDTQLGFANAILERSGAGIYVRRVPGRQRGGRGTGWIDAGTALGGLLTRGCAVADSIAASTAYRPGALNLYYVPRLGLDAASQDLGFVCWGWGAHREMLFVDHQRGLPLTLGHELGHALGLVTPNATSGHVGDVGTRFAGFERNLMRVGVGQPAVLTVGQAYRLQFDGNAWLNRPARRRDAAARSCQDDASTAVPCPKLGLPAPAAASGVAFAPDAPAPPDRLEDVRDWLDCHDCWGVNLDRATRWMMQGPESRQDSLMRIALEGPGPERLAGYEESLRRLYEQDSAYAAEHGHPLPPRAEFVATYRSRYDALWRTRAALALGCASDSTGQVPVRIREFFQRADTADRRGPAPRLRRSILSAVESLGGRPDCRRLTLR